MVDPDSPELILKRALAQFLHDNGAGVYKAAGSYVATERGIFTNGPTLPTTLDNCIVLATRKPIADGRANLIFPVDVYGRVKGNNLAANNLAGLLFGLLDHKSNVPPGLDISWCHEFSRLDISADSSGRSAFSSTYYLRGRRTF